MEISVAFVNASGIHERPIAKWVEACKTLKNMGATEDTIKQAVEVADDKGYTIVGPWSIINIVTNILRQEKVKANKAASKKDPTEMAREVW
jgi:hypothetical protein